MHNELFIWLKSLAILSIVWCTDVMILSVGTSQFVNPSIREFCLETKDVISWIVSILVLILTIIKIYKSKNK